MITDHKTILFSLPHILDTMPIGNNLNRTSSTIGLAIKRLKSKGVAIRQSLNSSSKNVSTTCSSEIKDKNKFSARKQANSTKKAIFPYLMPILTFFPLDGTPLFNVNSF